VLGGVMCGDNGGGAVDHGVVGEPHWLVDH
jgi:hypothetical protein